MKTWRTELTATSQPQPIGPRANPRRSASNFEFTSGNPACAKSTRKNMPAPPSGTKGGKSALLCNASRPRRLGDALFLRDLDRPMGQLCVVKKKG